MKPAFPWMVSMVLILGVAWGEEEETEVLPARKQGANQKVADLPLASRTIVELTNQFRDSNKLGRVKVNAELTRTAEYFAQYMAKNDRYGHQADGQNPAERAAKNGYDYCLILENIAYAYDSEGFEAKVLAGDFDTGWQNSPGHRENMLNPYVQEIGVAVAYSKRSATYFGVQLFGRSRSTSVQVKFSNETTVNLKYDLFLTPDAKEPQVFDLPPRMTRTHTLCWPGEYLFPWMPNADRAAMEAGVTYIARKVDGKYIIVPRKPEP